MLQLFWVTVFSHADSAGGRHSLLVTIQARSLPDLAMRENRPRDLVSFLSEAVFSGRLDIEQLYVDVGRRQEAVTHCAIWVAWLACWLMIDTSKLVKYAESDSICFDCFSETSRETVILAVIAVFCGAPGTRGCESSSMCQTRVTDDIPSSHPWECADIPKYLTKRRRRNRHRHIEYLRVDCMNGRAGDYLSSKLSHADIWRSSVLYGL